MPEKVLQIVIAQDKMGFIGKIKDPRDLFNKPVPIYDPTLKGLFYNLMKQGEELLQKQRRPPRHYAGVS